jgi:hypothetical protein
MPMAAILTTPEPATGPTMLRVARLAGVGQVAPALSADAPFIPTSEAGGDSGVFLLTRTLQVRLLPRAWTGVTQQADVPGLDPRPWEFDSPCQYPVPDRHSRSTYGCEVMDSLAVSKTAR